MESEALNDHGCAWRSRRWGVAIPGETVADLAVEVIAQEGITRSVGQGDDAELGVNQHHVVFHGRSPLAHDSASGAGVKP